MCKISHTVGKNMLQNHTSIDDKHEINYTTTDTYLSYIKYKVAIDSSV